MVRRAELETAAAASAVAVLETCAVRMKGGYDALENARRMLAIAQRKLAEVQRRAEIMQQDLLTK
jgi:hypothetical protein